MPASAAMARKVAPSSPSRAKTARAACRMPSRRTAFSAPRRFCFAASMVAASAGILPRQRIATVALFHRGLEADLLAARLEGDAFRAVPRDAVEQGGQRLRRVETHVVVGRVVHPFLHNSLVFRP